MCDHLAKRKEEIKISNYYVYRFIDKGNHIVYVGRTINLAHRFLNHEHLTDDVKKIEYIECATAGDMVWKEIYYINLFANEFTTNSSELYADGVTDLHLDDDWKVYSNRISNYIFDKERIIKNQELLSSPELISKIPLIHILENEKLNYLTKDKCAFSRKWFYDDKNKEDLKQLQKHVVNYFRNICHAKSSECLWTTFDETFSLVAGDGKGFKKGFISLNDENVTDRKYLTFICNLFYPINEKLSINEDNYALSEMLQFIWRSAIRDGKEIWVYIPSIRMRKLLKAWIAQNSFENSQENRE